MAPTLPVRAGSGRADGGNGVTIGRIGSVIERECGLEMILASPDDLPPTAANPDEVGDLEQYLDAADVAVVGVLHAFKCGDVLDQLADIKRRRGADFVPTVLVLGGTDVNVDAGDKADVLTRRAHAVDKVVSFSASMIAAAPPGSLPSDGRTAVVPQGVSLPEEVKGVPSVEGVFEEEGFEEEGFEEEGFEEEGFEEEGFDVADDAPSPPPPLPLHEACGVPTSMPVFLLPAGLRPVKDVLWAVDAVDAVGAGSADASPPFVLAIVGPSLDDKYRDAVVERLGRSKNVVLIPPVDRAHTVGYMRAATAVVNTSKSEGQRAPSSRRRRRAFPSSRGTFRGTGRYSTFCSTRRVRRRTGSGTRKVSNRIRAVCCVPPPSRLPRRCRARRRDGGDDPRTAPR